MSFDKKQYRENRKNGLRGQGDKESSIIAPSLNQEKYAVLSNGMHVKHETISKGTLYVEGRQVTESDNQYKEKK